MVIIFPFPSIIASSIALMFDPETWVSLWARIMPEVGHGYTQRNNSKMWRSRMLRWSIFGMKYDPKKTNLVIQPRNIWIKRIAH